MYQTKLKGEIAATLLFVPTYNISAMQWISEHKWLALGIGILCLVVIAISANAFILFSSYQSAVVTTDTLPEPAAPNATPSPTPDPLGPYSILLLGYGGPGHDGGALTDTIILAYIQPRKESIHLISLPRDIWVNLPLLPNNQTKGYKINAAYAIGRDPRQYKERPTEFTGDGGGGSLAKYAVKQITGIEPTYFMAVNFFAFEQAIDELGGIAVRVSQGFDDPYYPLAGEEKNACGKSEEEIAALSATLSGDLLNQQFNCRYEHLYFDAGLQEMDGVTALKFVRSRHSNQAGNDFSRAERQQAVIEATKQKIITLNFLPKIMPLLQSLARNLETDIDATTLSSLLSKAPEIEKYSVHRVVLSENNVLKASRSPDGQYVLLPDTATDSAQPWQPVAEFILKETE